MSLLFTIFLLAFVCVTVVYLYAFLRFYGIVKLEQPEWLQVRNPPGFYYTGAFAVGDPRVQIKLLRIAIGIRASQLQAPMAISYARVIRFLLPVGLALFIAALAAAFASLA